MSSDIVIAAKNISKCFEMYSSPSHRLWQTLCGGHRKFYNEFWALHDISFELKKGECLGVIGRNGAGKSTLLQIVTGTMQPTSGVISAKGRITALLELGSGFNPEFTGRENIYMNAAILGFSTDEINEKIDRIINFASIGDFIDHPIKTYSSGMMVRLAFSVQVMVDPDLLIVDEALSVGDAAFQFKCLARIKEILAKGASVLLVSHDSGTVKSFCTNCIWLKDGKVFAAGPSGQIVDAYDREIREESEQCQLIAPSSSQAQPQASASAAESGGKEAEGMKAEWRANPEFDSQVSSTRHGIGGGRIRNVELLDAAGNILVGASFDQTVIVRIYFELEQDVGDLAIYYIVKDAKNIELLGSGNYVENGQFYSMSKGRHIVEFKTSFPLTQGSYSISAVIGRMTVMNRAAVSFDYVENAYVFSVSSRQPYRIWSKVHVPNEIKLHF